MCRGPGDIKKGQEGAVAGISEGSREKGGGAEGWGKRTSRIGRKAPGIREKRGGSKKANIFYQDKKAKESAGKKGKTLRSSGKIGRREEPRSVRDE